MFDFQSIKDFESHIELSIPNYTGLCDIFRAFTAENSHTGGVVLDIGCSTGSFLSSLLRVPDVEYVGCDIVDICKHHNFEFIHCDAVEVFNRISKPVDVILSMFTLQFLGKHKRERVLLEVKRKVAEGTVFLVAEKVFMPAKVENVLKKEHIQQKRKAFSDSEILDKERDLFGVMHCESDGDFLRELQEIGNPTPIWQSYNFRGYVVTR